MTGTDDLERLPQNIPVPDDDGAADGLPRTTLPSVTLDSTTGETVDLSTLPGTVVVYCYPMTGRPDRGMPADWDSTPGARGCTPQSCAFRDHHAELRDLGARVFGLSVQDTAYQREAVERLHLPYGLLSDEARDFATALGLPTFEVEGLTLLKRLTFVAVDSRIEKVFYPVFPPDRNAEEVIEWLGQARSLERSS